VDMSPKVVSRRGAPRGGRRGVGCFVMERGDTQGTIFNHDGKKPSQTEPKEGGKGAVIPSERRGVFRSLVRGCWALGRKEAGRQTPVTKEGKVD